MKTLRLWYNTAVQSAWLGWQLESNWAEPWIFFIMCVVRPLSMLLIIVFMFYFATGGQPAATQASAVAASASGKSGGNLFTFFFVGNILYLYVYNILFGVSQVVFEDREHYEVIKYIYISPVNWYIYFVGRGLARFVIASISVIVSLLFGYFVFSLKFSIVPSALPALLASTAMGMLSIFFLGIIMSAFTLVMARHGNTLSESVSGIFFILCGTVFPIQTLPSWLTWLSVNIPISYWFEITRRLLFNVDRTIDTVWHGQATSVLLYRQGVSTVILCLASVAIFNFMSALARAKGIVDRTTSY